MKKYFVFENMGDVIIAEVKSVNRKEEILLFNTDTNNEKYFYEVVFGNFYKVIYAHKDGESEPVNIYYSLPGGGFSVVQNYRKDEEPFIKKKICLILNPNREKKYFLEFPDDNAAELWVEAVRGDYERECN